MATIYQFTNSRQFCFNISYGGLVFIYIEYSCSCLYFKQISLHVSLSKKTTKDCMNYATTFTEQLCYRSLLHPCYLHWQESVLCPRFLLLSFVIIHREPMASSERQLPHSILTSPSRSTSKLKLTLIHLQWRLEYPGFAKKKKRTMNETTNQIWLKFETVGRIKNRRKTL